MIDGAPAVRLWHLPPATPQPPLVEEAGVVRPPAVTPELARVANAALDAAAPALAQLPVAQIVAAIDAAVRRWQDANDPHRIALLQHGPALTGYGHAALTYAVDVMLGECRADGLQRLLRSELGDPAVLDGFAACGDALLLARGPGRQLHVYAGTVPTVPVIGIAGALLLKSPLLVKPSAHDPLVPALFAQTLAEVEPRLGAALAVLPWRGGDAAVEAAALEGAGAVVVHGSDTTVERWRERTPGTARFVGHGHRISVAAVGREALAGSQAVETARRLAWDVALFDQRGCLSPRLALVERGGDVSPEAFAEAVAAQLAALETTLPRGAIDPEEGARIQALRGAAAFRAAIGEPITLHASAGSTLWTVLCDGSGAIEPSPSGRFATLVPVDSLEGRLPDILGGLPVSSLGLAAQLARYAALAAPAGAHATRICPLGRMGEPPLTWRQDGVPVLAGLVTWAGVEGPRPPSPAARARSSPERTDCAVADGSRARGCARDPGSPH